MMSTRSTTNPHTPPLSSRIFCAAAHDSVKGTTLRLIRVVERRARVGGAENDEEERHRHHELRDQRRGHGITGGRMLPVAIRRESRRKVESALAAGDEIQHATRDHRADHLCDDVRCDLGGRKAPPAQSPMDTAGLRWQPEM